MEKEAEALRVAIATGNEEKVRQWLTHHEGRLNSIRDQRGRTPLHWASSGDSSMVTALLLDAGADPYARDNAGFLPMDYAPGERETEGRRWLLMGDDGQPFSHLLALPEAEALRFDWATRPGRRQFEDGRTALMLACAAGRAKIAQVLLRAGARPGDVDWVEERDAIYVAIEAGQPACLELVLKADPTLRDRRHRFFVGDIPALLQPLHLAAGFGQLACLEVLLAAGASLDARGEGDRYAWTPLHLAARQGYAAVVQRLLVAGADPSLADGRLGFNALQWAMKCERQEVVEVIQAWATERKVDLLRPFHHDTNDTDVKFPLYHAPLRLPPGHCCMCDRDAAHVIKVSHLLAPCPSCGETKAYRVDDAGKETKCEGCEQSGDWPAAWPRHQENIRVCYECLRAGRAAVGHKTELGLTWPPYSLRGMAWGGSGAKSKAAKHGLKTTVLEAYEDGCQAMGIHLPQPLLDELMRTPKHPSRQREYWPFHCGGWMHYLGRWQRRDFERRAPGRGQKWFSEHVHPREMADDYWDWLESDIGWSSVYACPRCGLHNVYVDSD